MPRASRRGSERCEAPGPIREAGDRPEGREVSVRLYTEPVDRLGTAGLQHVQVLAVVAQRDVVDAGADQRGAAVRIDQADRPVGRDREGRHRAGAVAGEADAPVIGHNGPAWCALVREHGAAHQRNTTGRVQLVGRGRSCGFRHEQLVAMTEGEPERRAASGGSGGGPARDAARVHGIHVELIGVLLGDHEAAAVGTERHLRRSHVRAREGQRPSALRVTALCEPRLAPVPVPPVETVPAAVSRPSAPRANTATALPPTWLVSVYTAPGSDTAAETSASRAACSAAAGPVTLGLGSHAASAAVASARTAKRVFMVRYLRKMVNGVIHFPEVTP